jgi:hypothetical protein
MLVTHQTAFVGVIIVAVASSLPVGEVYHFTKLID